MSCLKASLRRTPRYTEKPTMTRRKTVKQAKHKAKPSKRSSKAITKPYEPTPYEHALMDNLNAETKETPLPPQMKVTQNDGGVDIEVDHPDFHGGVRLMKALGTTDATFLHGLIGQIASIASKGQELDEKDLNFMLVMVEGVKPKDQVEAMLAAQMAAVHNATMTYARRLNVADTIMQSDAAERTFNKLARTFTTQVAALKQYRTGGQQKMTVEHVHVHEGGQAIVGNVQGGGAA